jgi:hypothetical protein
LLIGRCTCSGACVCACWWVNSFANLLVCMLKRGEVMEFTRNGACRAEKIVYLKLSWALVIIEQAFD